MSQLLFNDPHVVEIDGEILPHPGLVPNENPYKASAELFKDHPGMDRGSIELDRAPNDVVSLDESEPIVVDLGGRNILLGAAITNLASASRLSSLINLAENEEFPGMRKILEHQYDDVDALSGRSYDKKEKHIRDARMNFFEAYGLDVAIKGADVDEQEILKIEAERDFVEFVKKFGDSRGSKAREKYRRQLAKQLKLLEKKKLDETA